MNHPPPRDPFERLKPPPGGLRDLQTRLARAPQPRARWPTWTLALAAAICACLWLALGTTTRPPDARPSLIVVRVASPPAQVEGGAPLLDLRARRALGLAPAAAPGVRATTATRDPLAVASVAHVPAHDGQPGVRLYLVAADPTPRGPTP